MKQETIDKRNALKALSAQAKQFIDEGKAASINHALTIIYEIQGHQILKSFRGWLKEGYAVRKGEKALLLWGEPLKALNQEKKQDNEKDEFKFFPLAYVFSEKQVEKL